jgi:hypothetical protein
MEKVVRKDPFYVEMKELEDSETPPPGRAMPRASDSYHIWQALLPADLEPGQYLLEVREVDMWGIPKVGHRSVRVE